MGVKEVRIGNWVKIYGLPEQVNNITTDDVNGYAIDRYEPIPLTEDILLQCGFRIDDYDSELVVCWLGSFNLRLTDKRIYYSVILHKSIEVKYLHQLQNLYFAITNKELEVAL